MVEKVKELVKEIDKLEEQFMSMFKTSDLLEMEDEGIKMLKQYVGLVNISKELMIESAETIDNMNNKLDTIDSKLDMLVRHID